MRLTTERLELVLDSVEETLAGLEAMPPEMQEHLSEDWLDRVRNATEPDPWIHGFTTLLDGAPIGSCGFKGPPDAAYAVEIAYQIQSEHEGNGYATECARALVRWALRDSGVWSVIAHTLPEVNASTRVLTKCGFQNKGEVLDPDDGRVWRWEISSDGGMSRRLGRPVKTTRHETAKHETAKHEGYHQGATAENRHPPVM